jgi:DNA primase
MTIFDFIRQKVEIYDVVVKRVNLRKLGSYWKGSCPFHSETDASFTISPDKRIFYCFGCHESGDVVAFVAKAEDVPQIEAAQIIIQEFSLQLPKELLLVTEVNVDAKQGLEMSKRACSVFASWAHLQLLENTFALNYLFGRGITKTSIERFCLGFFPLPEPINIEKMLSFAAKQGILAGNLIDAGIMSPQNQTLWSPFTGRIIFPIRESDGKTVGFGGRIILADDSRPKYYNSKESLIFHKGSVLFGMDLAKQPAKKNKSGFLVEGYMDCVAMSQHGFEETFAVLGTACTPTHIKSLSRFLKTLYVVYDADRAGQAAVLKLAKNCWDVEIDLKVIVLPAGEDPASFLQHNGNMQPLIEAALEIFDFFLQKTGEKFIGSSIADKIELTREVVKTICQLEDLVKRDLLLLEVARVFQLPVSSLKNIGLRFKQVSSSSLNVETPTQNQGYELQSSCDSGFDSLAKQVLFMHISAQKEGISGFNLSEQVENAFQGTLKKIHQTWVAALVVDGETNRFNIFLDSLSEHDRTWVLKGVLLSEQNLDARMFFSLTRELEKRSLKKLILRVRQKATQTIFGEQEDPATVLRTICELGKKVRTRG